VSAIVTVTDPAEPVLAKMTPDVRALAEEIRPLIKQVMPEVGERPHIGWSAIFYCVDGKMRNMVVAIHPQRAYLNLEFGDGIDLPDPAHRLEGTGKRMRHVKIRSSDDVHHPDVRALLDAAARHRGLQTRT
jgi:hypothetical protein